uniref:KN motif and ankyrin repeat domain-containing protein 1-like n=1 Tax=Centroberyx gerrardi TaxID=166262 RepID=UPI003AAB7705
MAQGGYILRNGSGHSGKGTEECVPYYPEAAYSYQLDLGYLKCVDDFQNSTTIKRLSLKRRPRVAVNNVEKPQNETSPGQWHSSESLSSSSSDDTRLLAMSSMTRGRPPRPPPHGSSSDNPPSRNEGPAASQILPESKPLPAARSLTLPRHNPLVEKTLMETRKRLEQERTIQPPPEPHPRRRLASFGGIGSTGSLSPFTGLGAFNQNNNGNKPTGTGGDLTVHLSSALGSRGSTGSLRLSPQSSGRSTPVSLGPMHLQHVRDQMVVALQRLKELEEQVKIIPILQVKISVLQEEKRQLVSQFKNQNDNQDLNDVIWRRAYSVGSSDHFQRVSEFENQVKTEEGLEGIVQSDCTGLREFRQLTEEMQALERTIKGGRLQARHGISYSTLHDRPVKSVAIGTDDDIGIILSKPTKENKYVDTEKIETRSIATGVSEVNLGIVTEREAELDAQQQIIEALKERICHLEAELKESALQTEMSRLKLELQAAGARNRVDKASIAKPSTESTGTEARPHTRSQGVGNHTEHRDASTGEMTEVKRCTVGVSCMPDLRNVSTGPDVPMSHWEVRERVESREQCVGIQVITNTQGVGTEIKVCDAETNTDITMENLGSGKGQMEHRSLTCEYCSVGMKISEAKEVVSLGMATDPVRGVDLGIMASPQTASQRTNTIQSNSVSRFTSTRHAFNTNSSTNTVLNTQDKHTNTTQTVTRTVSVGNRVRDIQGIPETRSVGVGTATLVGSTLKQTPVTVTKATRDTGVGFTNINENFLVGLKTRNMACGPSHLPDPTKTRSIGQSAQSQWDPELNHYIEKMQRLLREQQGLLTESYSEQGEVFVQQQSSLGNISSKLTCINTATAQGGTEVHPLDSQSTANRAFQSLSRLSNDSSNSDKAKSEIYQLSCNESEVKRRIQMIEQQASSALQDRPTNVNMLRSIMKKQNGDQGCSSNRKTLKFMRVTTGLDPMSIYGPSASEEANAEEEEQKGNRKWREVPGQSDQDGQGKGVSSRDLKGSATSDTQQRFKLSEKMFSACQALRIHLSDDTTLSSRDLHACLHTLQQEWFRVSSQKSAVPNIVEDYLSAFRVISPSVLQHVANLADGNGNTALHYSVSHSNFGVVKKMLDAEVCNVNQQNKAGYTPIMLAALAAVETPEDMRVVEELFTKGDVNAKASQAGQTALMLAVSHGRMDMVQALLAQGAEVNLQDDEGSTALMCASEHGHADIVKLLLAQPDCNATLTDSDESTALSIALEAGHNDIAVLLYAHANFSKGQAGVARLGGKPLSSPGGRNIFE